MTNQEAQIKLNALKRAHERNLKIRYQKSAEQGVERQEKYLRLMARQKQESAELNQKFALAEQDPKSQIYQLKEFHKKEMETFIKESAPADAKYKMKLISLKIKHKTELIGCKRQLQAEETELYILHHSERDALDIERDYQCNMSAKESEQLNICYDIERKAVINSFMYANKKYKVGDTLSDQDRAISVRWFSCGDRSSPWEKLDDSLDVSYGGYLLDKNGKPRADGATARIWQSDVIK
ncbi:hypothetical protein MUK70_25330 [Dyadobacter chenwenxiniae]|uniref:Uncharacterized protein n=1 Tax=Dyadobacter chenwenxiniae TaxID=2906456 RepID=A0A9X1PSS0_9BACT|nr:hypothetical protein [Dyadobacter chenwenxiniae]MCF0064446.1 hypothetical protein [Dyadobacter chenwenxiniae]UON82351.1 hypothetical protein MUK70_25330 [Dyadobacter chenwenxiniae]